MHPATPYGEAAVPKPVVVQGVQTPDNKKYPVVHVLTVTAFEANVHVEANEPHVTHVFDVVFKTYVA